MHPGLSRPTGGGGGAGGGGAGAEGRKGGRRYRVGGHVLSSDLSKYQKMTLTVP